MAAPIPLAILDAGRGIQHPQSCRFPAECRALDDCAVPQLTAWLTWSSASTHKRIPLGWMAQHGGTLHVCMPDDDFPSLHTPNEQEGRERGKSLA